MKSSLPLAPPHRNGQTTISHVSATRGTRGGDSQPPSGTLLLLVEAVIDGRKVAGFVTRERVLACEPSGWAAHVQTGSFGAQTRRLPGRYATRHEAERAVLDELERQAKWERDQAAWAEGRQA